MDFPAKLRFLPRSRIFGSFVVELNETLLISLCILPPLNIMATNQTAAVAPATTAVPANPGTDDPKLSSHAKSTKHDGKQEDTPSATNGAEVTTADPKKRLNANNAVPIQSNGKKSSKSRHKSKVIKTSPPSGDSDKSQSSSDDSDDESSGRSSGSDSDVDSSEPSRKRSRGKKSKMKEKRRKQKHSHSRKAEKKSRSSPRKSTRVGHRVKDANTSSESDSDDLSDSSTTTGLISDASSIEVARKDKRRSGTTRSLHSRNIIDQKSLDLADTNDQIRNLQLQLTQLTQQISSLHQSGQLNAQVPPYSLGGQPQMAYQLPQTTVLPGTASSFTSTPFAETNIIENPLPVIRNPLRNRGRKSRVPLDLTSRAPSETLADTGQLSDSLGSLRDQRSGKKKRKGTRADFKRVDWVWDTSLYTWKLQDSTESTSDAQYDEYIFHVRRSFDIEGKYRSTMVDIKSKLLRECLQDVIGDIKGLSLVDESPKTDPNMLFL